MWPAWGLGWREGKKNIQTEPIIFFYSEAEPYIPTKHCLYYLGVLSIGELWFR